MLDFHPGRSLKGFRPPSTTTRRCSPTPHLEQRTVNIGVVSPERALQLGFSGPCCAARDSLGSAQKQAL